MFLLWKSSFVCLWQSKKKAISLDPKFPDLCWENISFVSVSRVKSKHDLRSVCSGYSNISYIQHFNCHSANKDGWILFFPFAYFSVVTLLYSKFSQLADSKLAVLADWWLPLGSHFSQLAIQFFAVWAVFLINNLNFDIDLPTFTLKSKWNSDLSNWLSNFNQ